MNRGDLHDANDVTMKSGIYAINKDITPDSGVPYNFGGLLVFSAPGTASGGNPILQIAFSNTGDVKTRMKWWTAGFTDWYTVTK